MNNRQIERVLDCLLEAGPAGLSLFKLAQKTKVNITKIRKFLAQNRDFVLKVGASRKYKINRFGKYKGDKQAMMSALVKKQRTINYGTVIPAIWCVTAG